MIWLGAEDLPLKPIYPGNPAPAASNYILLNFFMIRPDLAVIDHAPELEAALRSNGVLSYVIPFSESRTLGGGHHCCTLDLHRK